MAQKRSTGTRKKSTASTRKKTPPKASKKPADPAPVTPSSDKRKTKDQLIEELAGLRRKTAGLETKVKKQHPSGDDIKQSEELFRGMFEMHSSVMLLIDPESGSIIEANQAAADYYGYSIENLRSLSVTDINTLSRDEVKAEMDKAVSRNRNFFNFKHITSNGQVRDVEVFSTPIDVQGKGLLFSIIHDVTDKKIAESELRSQKEFTEHALNAQLDTFFVFEPATGKAVRWNKAFNDITGYTDEEIASKKAPFDWYDDEDLKKAAQATKELDKSGKASVELSLITKDGGKILTEYVISLAKGVDDTEYIVSIGRDVTERNISEESLRDSLQMSDDLLGAIPSGIYIYDFQEPDRLILVNANKAAEVLTGIKLSEWKGKEFNEIWPGAKEQGITEAYLNVMRTGTTFESEDLVYSDERISAAFRVRTFTLPNNRLASAFEDITERKKTEKALKESEEKFSKIFHVSPNSIAISSFEDGTLIDGNKGFEKLTGYTREEFIGKTTIELNLWLYPNERAKMIDILKIDGHVRDYEMDVQTKTGEIRFIQMSIDLIEINDKKYAVTISNDITERKKIEQQLLEEKKFSDVILENLPGLFYMFDTQARLVRWNKSVEKTAGYTHDEIRGKHVLDFYREEEKEEIRRFFEEIITSGAIHRFESNILTKDGSIVPHFETAHKVTLEGEDYLVGTAIDMSELKEAEAGLRESELKYRTIVDNVHAGISKTNLNGELIFANRALLDITGFGSFEEMAKDNMLSTYVDPGDRDVLVEKLRKDGRVDNFQTDLKRKDGQTITVLMNAVLDGEVVTTMLMDITEKTKAEQRLLEEKRFSSEILDNLPGLFYMFDAQGRIVRWNKMVEKALGYSHDELSGKRVLDFYRQEDHEEITNIFKDIITKGAIHEFKGNILMRDGNHVPYYLVGHRIELESEDYLVGTAINISELKKAESMVQKSLKEKELLLSEIHHRVKNNLSVISAILSLQSGQAPDNVSRDMFLDTGGRLRAMALVHEKLYRSDNLASIEFGNYISEIVSELAATRPGTSVEVDVENVIVGIDTAVPLGMIVHELVTNAFKHAFVNKSNSVLEVCFKKEGNENMTLIVRDNGIGLPESIDMTKPDSLGLRLLTSLVSQINGKMEIFRQKGTEIRVSFNPQGYANRLIDVKPMN